MTQQIPLFDTGHRPDLRPGSPEAKAVGCRCPASDNHLGAGHALVNRDRGWDRNEWVIDDRCRLHWPGPAA